VEVVYSEQQTGEDMITIVKRKIDNAAGKVCEIILPIKQECYFGNGSSIAICTLSSMNLLVEIAKTPSLMNKILIVGRLLSENRGIDKIIKFSIKNPSLHHIIVCGTDVKGHTSGQALLSLHKNGVNGHGTILGATAHYPFSSCSATEIQLFRTQTLIHDMIGTHNLEKLVSQVSLLS
jgi:tetrahydromethanopterin S-methyltransferase subunit A